MKMIGNSSPTFLILALISIVSALLILLAPNKNGPIVSVVNSNFESEQLIQRRLRPTTTLPNNETIPPSHQNRSLLMGIQLERTTFKIPHILDTNLVDWDQRPSENKRTEIPFFWHILKSGGTTLKLMYATCYKFVEASETGGWVEAILVKEEEAARLRNEQQQQQQQQRRDSNEQGEVSVDSAHQEEIMKSQEILFANLMNQQQEQKDPNNSRLLQQQRELTQQWELWQQESQQTQQQQQQKRPLRIVDAGDGRKYVNIDVTTPSGIQNAVDRGFASNLHMADVIFTPLLVEGTAKLLNGENKGRLFAMFRHPVDRVTSMFYYLQTATWEPTYNPIYSNMTIEDYIHSPTVESNWMVRSLVNKLEGPLHPDDVKIAKEILHKKCLVGLMDRMEESVLRFHKYFGFENNDALECAKREYTSKDKGSRMSEQNRHMHPKLDVKGETYALLMKINRLDGVLFEYAVRLFDEQGEWMKKQNLI